MAYPTRPDPIPLADKRHIIGNTFQITLVPQVPPEDKELYTLNMKDMIEHFSSDPSLEGILHVDTPEKSTTVFYVVFSGILDICNGRVQFKPRSFDQPARDSRLRIRWGDYGSPDGDRLPLVYGAGYDLLHREVAGLSRRLLATIPLSDSAVQSTLTKRDPLHMVGEVRR